MISSIVYETLNEIVFGKVGGVKNVVADRVLMDLIAANTDLAVSPLRGSSSKKMASETLHEILDK
jgi:hypothetical protein